MVNSRIWGSLTEMGSPLPQKDHFAHLNPTRCFAIERFVWMFSNDPFQNTRWQPVMIMSADCHGNDAARKVQAVKAHTHLQLVVVRCVGGNTENSLTLPFCLSLIRDGEFCSLDLHSLSSPARMVVCFRESTPSVGSLWFLFGWKNLCWVFLCELSFFLLAIFYTFWFPPDQWTLLRLWFLGPMFFFFVYLSLMESVGDCGFFSQRQLLNTKGPVCLNPFF